MTRRAALAALAAAHTGVVSVLAAGNQRFGGTFLQLGANHREWTPDQWAASFRVFRQLGLTRLIVQWTEDYLGPPLVRLFDQAGNAKIRVELGLCEDRRFWTAGSGTFGDLKKRSKKLLGGLRHYVDDPWFAGWYIPQEIDDVRWSKPRARKELTDYLKWIAKECRKIAAAPVSLSAFSNGTAPPRELALFLRRLMRDANLDFLLFQDGIGARKLTLDMLPSYYEALRDIAEPVIEIFDMISEDPFQARPAPLDRVRRQLELARRAGHPAPMVFSVPEYQTPELLAEFGTT